jgi:hypothetical protein
VDCREREGKRDRRGWAGGLGVAFYNNDDRIATVDDDEGGREKERRREGEGKREKEIGGQVTNDETSSIWTLCPAASAAALFKTVYS